LYLAQALLDLNEVQAAHRELEAILSQPLDDKWRWEQARDKEVAAQLLNGQ
jgi:hypothetical protein